MSQSSETNLGTLFEQAAAVCPELRTFAYPHDLPASLRFQDGEWHWWRSGVLINNCPPAHRDAHIDSAVLNWAEKRGDAITFGPIGNTFRAMLRDWPMFECFGLTRQHAALQLVLSAPRKALSPAKDEAKPEAKHPHYSRRCGEPEAGTVPPEGMPEPLLKEWDQSQRVYRDGVNCYRMFPKRLFCFTGGDKARECQWTEANPEMIGTLLPSRPAPTPSPAGEADSIARVIEDLEGECQWTGPVRRAIERLRALAANQSDQSDRQLAYDAGVRAGMEAARGKSSPQAAEVADWMEKFGREIRGMSGEQADEWKEILRAVRRLQPTREMPGSVRAALAHLGEYQELLAKSTMTGGVRQRIGEVIHDVCNAFTPAPAPDAVPVVRVTHGVQSVESGLILNVGDEAACRKFCDEYTTEVYRLVRLDWSNA